MKHFLPVLFAMTLLTGCLTFRDTTPNLLEIPCLQTPLCLDGVLDDACYAVNPPLIEARPVNLNAWYRSPPRGCSGRPMPSSVLFPVTTRPRPGRPRPPVNRRWTARTVSKFSSGRANPAGLTTVSKQRLEMPSMTTRPCSTGNSIMTGPPWAAGSTRRSARRRAIPWR